MVRSCDGPCTYPVFRDWSPSEQMSYSESEKFEFIGKHHWFQILCTIIRCAFSVDDNCSSCRVIATVRDGHIFSHFLSCRPLWQTSTDMSFISPAWPMPSRTWMCMRVPISLSIHWTLYSGETGCSSMPESCHAEMGRANTVLMQRRRRPQPSNVLCAVCAMHVDHLAVRRCASLSLVGSSTCEAFHLQCMGSFSAARPNAAIVHVWMQRQCTELVVSDSRRCHSVAMTARRPAGQRWMEIVGPVVHNVHSFCDSHSFGDGNASMAAMLRAVLLGFSSIRTKDAIEASMCWAVLGMVMAACKR